MSHTEVRAAAGPRAPSLSRPANDDVAQLPSAHVHVLRNATVDALKDSLRLEASSHRMRVDTTFSSYDPIAGSFEGASSTPQARVTLAVVLLTLDPMRGAFERDSLQPDFVFEQVSRLANHAIQSGAKRVLLSTFLPPLGTGGRNRDAAALYELNGRVARLAESDQRFGLLDVARIAAQLGDDKALDKRFWRLFESPFSPCLLGALAHHVRAELSASLGATKKVLVVDADNTLWGGVVGEDGIDAIALSPNDAAGRPFHAFQRQLLALKRSGVLLALASKNELADVLAVLESHPDCLLHRDDFAALRVDWTDKATNIESLANELGLGLDSFVFIDDSDTECERVRQALPMVDVLQVPRETHDLPFVLGRYLGFQASTTIEDRQRADDYAAEALRKCEFAKHADLASFVRSLEVVAAVGPLTTANLARAAQLTQRTNQFNLTTVRQDVTDIERLLTDDDTLVVAAHISDRFGPQGMTGLAIVERRGQRGHIRAFLLSCRVLGRQIERAFLAETVALARARFGSLSMIGEFRPTPKNGQTQSFYPTCGFVPLTTSVEQSSFELPEGRAIEMPDFITIDRRPL